MLLYKFVLGELYGRFKQIWYRRINITVRKRHFATLSIY